MNKRLLILLCALMCVCTEALAERRVKVGARAGLLSRSLTLDQETLVFKDVNGNPLREFNEFATESKYGFNASFVFRVRVWESKNPITGASLHLELDADYAQNNLVFAAKRVENDEELEAFTSKVLLRTVDVPLVLCLKASVVRLCAGPVFHAYSQYEVKSGKIGFSGVKPLCGYTLGIGFDFGKVTLDGRYCGEFTKGSWNMIKDEQAAPLTGRLAGWSINLGVAF